MISINVKGESVNTLKKSYYRTADNWFGFCYRCKRLYQHFGTYPRETPRLFAPFYIKRVYCVNCKKSHALLPCFIIPYARHLDVVREAAIVAICFDTHTIEELAELLDTDPTTVARWWRIFRSKAGVMTMALAEKLANSPQLSDWVSGDLGAWPRRARKILELIGRCRATFSPDFAFCGFAWINIFNPNLLFDRKGVTDRGPGADSTG